MISQALKGAAAALVMLLGAVATSGSATTAQSPWQCWEVIGSNGAVARVVTSRTVKPGRVVAVGGMFSPDGLPNTAADLQYLGRDDTGMTFRRREVIIVLSNAAIQKWIERVRITDRPARGDQHLGHSGGAAHR